MPRPVTSFGANVRQKQSDYSANSTNFIRPTYRENRTSILEWFCYCSNSRIQNTQCLKKLYNIVFAI